MTEALFRDDSYLKSCAATVAAVNDRGGVVLDRTVFYPTGGGQPGDSGTMTRADGSEVPIATTVKGDTPDQIVHVLPEDATCPDVGEKVTVTLDWDRRYAHMRMHTCLHLLSAVLPYPVTGGQVGAEKSRLDFDIQEAILDKDTITAQLNELIEADDPVSFRWITDAELEATPELVKTMSVKPPTGAGHVRLIEVSGRDLQPCGGTHISRTGEIGPVEVRKIEKKGRQNRRVSIQFKQ
ncbi:alanyl-tRNA editing protein [Minwuia sp.]|uniref:alanyl-tRNA editing protein n=1 Tax=Minwuia sp. TaxID=2493630 RepID=UPI003A927E62